MKRILCFTLSLLAVLFVFFENYVPAEASSEIGIIAAIDLRLRQGPGTEYKIIEELAIDTTCIINSKGYSDSTGAEWYNVTAPSGNTGYVMGKHVVVEPVATYSYEADFEAYLTAQGFPESYKPYLRELHAKYPNWTFKAAKTGLEWSDVIEKESSPGRSLIGSSYPASYKSMEQGCYDFGTGKYITYDSGGWVTASVEVVKYYMDPRNFLNTTNIFQFLTHSFDASTQTVSGLKNVLSGTFMDGDFPESGYSTWADAIYAAGQTYSVNPYVLASMILVEQGTKGTGGCITSGTGYYNFFNVGAYRTSSMTAVQRGLWYARQSGSYGRPWNSRLKSILGGAQFYSENYVTQNKNTLYFKKWNVMNGIDSVGKYQYMSNVMGAYTEGLSLRAGYLSALNTPMTFLIPVYNNMPQALSELPEKTAANNNFLTSLDVKGYELTPEFSMYTTEYELVVGTSVTSLDISATALESGAKISGTGTTTLIGDTMSINVQVTASSGSKKTYTILVSKMVGGQTDNTIKIPTLESSAYTISDYITGVSPGTSYDKFTSNLAVSNGTFMITNSTGNIITSGTIGTGNMVYLMDIQGNLTNVYTVRINGDITGDGKISTADLLLMQKHIVGVETLSGLKYTAADINHDQKISTADLLFLRQHIVGSYTISQ